MAPYFFDSSGIAKRYIVETGSVWVGNLTALTSGNEIYLAEITTVEVISALTRRNRGNTLATGAMTQAVSDFRHHLVTEYNMISISSALLLSAVVLTLKHGLRGYDAVQLAAALQIRNERLSLGANAPVLVSADIELNAAALAEGLLIENPNLYP